MSAATPREPVPDDQASSLGLAVLTPRQRRRRRVRAVLQVLAIAALVVALYNVLPLGRLTEVPAAVFLTVALVLLSAVSAWHIRAVIDSDQPTFRAGEALVGMIPLFLVVFAVSYYMMVGADPTSFTLAPMTRTDALDVTVTIFSTTGFGDIVAVSEQARLVVMLQMVLDLVIFTLGVRLLTRAVHVGQARHAPQPREDGAP